jgi:hypothetical protein
MCSRFRSSSPTNPTWTDLGKNPGLHGGRPAANHLSHGIAHTQDMWICLRECDTAITSYHITSKKTICMLSLSLYLSVKQNIIKSLGFVPQDRNQITSLGFVLQDGNAIKSLHFAPQDRNRVTSLRFAPQDRNGMSLHFAHEDRTEQQVYVLHFRTGME